MRDDRSLDERLAPHEFVSDLVWAARAIWSQPSVAFVSVALWLFPILYIRLALGRSNAMALIFVGVIPFLLGWNGIERIFFLARREGHEVTLGQLLASVPFFVGRFARLGCLLILAAFPFVYISFLFADRFQPADPRALHRFVIAVVAVPADIALTFVTSALVFSTRSAMQALRIGLGMIRQTWPRCGLYVLCPPLALKLLNVVYPTDILIVRLLTTVGLALLALLAKGSMAAFYLRERPVSPDVVADAL
jgi:hypothetical protein